jgi:hypothetical protein
MKRMCGTVPVVQVKEGPTDLVESFAAVLMKLTLEHRGDHGINLTKDFERRIANELARYERKPDATLDHLRQMQRMADAAVTRAIAAGRVLAFEPGGYATSR